MVLTENKKIKCREAIIRKDIDEPTGIVDYKVMYTDDGDEWNTVYSSSSEDDSKRWLKTNVIFERADHE